MGLRGLRYPGGARAAPGGGAPTVTFMEPSYVPSDPLTRPRSLSRPLTGASDEAHEAANPCIAGALKQMPGSTSGRG
jgi:hypothetical protein